MLRYSDVGWVEKKIVERGRNLQKDEERREEVEKVEE